MKTLTILAALLLTTNAFAQSTYDSNRAQERLNEQMRQQQQAYDNQVNQQRQLQIQQEQLRETERHNRTMEQYRPQIIQPCCDRRVK